MSQLNINYRQVLQLCCFTNLWGNDYEVESYDLRIKKNVFDVPDHLPGTKDIVCAAPPCDQFTKANAHSWQDYPAPFIEIAKHCFELCKLSGGLWFLENPPGRIEQFIPGLKPFRTITWRSPNSNKEYVIYSNFIILQSWGARYGRNPEKKYNNMSNRQREAWDPALIEDIKKSING